VAISRVHRPLPRQIYSRPRGDESLVRLESLTLSQMQNQFTELAKHVERWNVFARRFDEFLQKMDGEVNAIRELVSAIGASKNKLNPELANLNPVIRDITAPQAAEEILILFRKKKKVVL
jgi:antitoxin component HigA of HigAB toxin-antitoxin module